MISYFVREERSLQVVDSGLNMNLRKINESQTKNCVWKRHVCYQKSRNLRPCQHCSRKFDRYQFVASSNRHKGRSDKSKIEILIAYEEVKSEFWSSCDARVRSIHSVFFTHNRLFFISRSLNDWFAFGNSQRASREWCNFCESARKILARATSSYGNGRDLERHFPPTAAHKCTSEPLASSKLARRTFHSTHTAKYFSYCHEKICRSERIALEYTNNFSIKNTFFVVAVEQKHWELYRSIQFL